MSLNTLLALTSECEGVTFMDFRIEPMGDDFRLDLFKLLLSKDTGEPAGLGRRLL